VGRGPAQRHGQGRLDVLHPRPGRRRPSRGGPPDRPQRRSAADHDTDHHTVDIGQVVDIGVGAGLVVAGLVGDPLVGGRAVDRAGISVGISECDGRAFGVRTVGSALGVRAVRVIDVIGVRVVDVHGWIGRLGVRIVGVGALVRGGSGRIGAIERGRPGCDRCRSAGHVVVRTSHGADPAAQP